MANLQIVVEIDGVEYRRKSYAHRVFKTYWVKPGDGKVSHRHVEQAEKRADNVEIVAFGKAWKETLDSNNIEYPSDIEVIDNE